MAMEASSSSSSWGMISARELRSDLYSYYPGENSRRKEEERSPLVISVLASLISRNMGRKQGSRGKSYLEGEEAPDMSIESYLERIFKYTRAGPPVYVVAYVYIDRLSQRLPHFRITPSNVHRLLITAIMLASKYVEDMNYRNSYFARVGGLTTKELNKLELDFLFLMGFKLHVNVTVFHTYCTHLQREVSIGGGYHIERALSSCANQINLTHLHLHRTTPHDQISRIAL